MLAGRDAAVAEHVRIGDERRDSGIVGRAEPGDRAAIGRIELLRVAEADVVERRRVAGQAVIGRRVVVSHRVVHRSHLGEPVDHRGETRQVLGDRETRLAGGDRRELAPDARRRVGLHVERVQVRRSAELVQEDHVPGPRPHAGTARARPLASSAGKPSPATPAKPAWISRRRVNRPVTWIVGATSHGVRLRMIRGISTTEFDLKIFLPRNTRNTRKNSSN